nr:hypothetical protein [Tanacetum cinerariifolium]
MDENYDLNANVNGHTTHLLICHTSSTPNVQPLTDITNIGHVSGQSQRQTLDTLPSTHVVSSNLNSYQTPKVRRGRGRPCLGLTFDDNHVRVSSRPTPQIEITSRTVVDTNGNPFHMGNPFHVTGSFNNSVNSMSHSHHIRGSTSPNNTTNSSQNARQRHTPQTVISSRTVVDNTGNLNSDHLENTVGGTGVNNTFVTSIPCSTRSKRIASANNATDPNLYLNARQNHWMFECWDCGDAVHQCPHCAAMLWYEERTTKSRSPRVPKFSICCSEGKVQLSYLEHPSKLLQELMHYNGGQRSKLFRKHIKLLCSMFSFTLTGGKIYKEINNGGAPYTFQLNGQNHHKIGTLLPTHEDGRPRFAQLYIFDTANEVENRFYALNRKLTSSPKDVMLQITRKRNTRQYNLPTASEIAALAPGDGNPTDSRDVIVEERGGEEDQNYVKRIFELHPSFMALQYPLLFPYKEDGFQLYIHLNVPPTTKRKYLSLKEYYSFRLHNRLHEGKTLLKDWYKINQNTIRSELYNRLHDRVSNGESDLEYLGRKLILPSIFTEGPRHIVQQYQDAMEICRWVGPPDLFLTMTCNPNWPEIQRHVEDAIPELPSEVDDPIRFEAVRSHMMHGQCGELNPSNSCPDRATIVIEGQNNRPSSGLRTSYASIVHRENEIEEYLNCRYISASEACWKIYGFEMHYCSIAVERLPFHEKGCNKVYFREEDDVEIVVDRATSAMSKFTGWMKANIIYLEGRSLTYSNYPTMFTWHDSDKEWRPRKNGMAIGCIYYVTPSMRENYYLRMLLNVVRGYRSWEEICTVDGIECQHTERLNNKVVFTNEEIQNYTLMEIEMILNGNNKSLKDFLNLPQINHNLLNMGTNRLIAEERRAKNQVFDGKVVVLGGDFRQILPVIPKERRNEIVSSVIMNLNQWILDMGDERLPADALDQEDEATWITIPDDLLIPINSHVLEKMPGEMHEMLSADEIDPTTGKLEEMQIMYPSKFLNTLRLSGILNHKLDLKIGAPVILLRNTNLRRSLCNGTRRRQFPVKVCFGMTINKSQGQTFNHVCAYLEKPVFTHGQLYVVASRVTSRAGIRFYIDNERICDNNMTKNVVYKEVYNNLPIAMSNRYRYISELCANVTDNWTVNVMVSRVWTTYNPKNNQFISLDIIIVDGRRNSIHVRFLEKLINKYKNLIVEGQVHNIHRFMMSSEFFANGVMLEKMKEEAKVLIPIFVKLLCVIRYMKLRISLWGKLALKYTDDMIRSQKDTSVIVILTSCRVRRYGGGLQLTTTVATHFYLNLPIANFHAYNQRPIQPVEFPFNVLTSNGLKTEEINIITIPDFYQHLANGVNVRTKFIFSSMVIGIDLYNDWKFIRCPTYKLVITICTQDDEEINYVLFNTIANQLLGYTVKELLTKSIKEGADVPYWLDDFFVDKLIGRSIVLRIKIDKYNLAPTFVRRMMDEIQWGSVSGSTTPIPKTAIEVPLSTVHEVRAPNMEPSKDGFENGIKCETNTTIIDIFEGSPTRATMTNEDNPSDTHTDSATSHAYNDAVYVCSEALKEADTKVFDTKEVVMMEVDMKECDMRQVDVKEVVIDEEDTKESNVKKDNMKQVDVKEAVMDEEKIRRNL